MQQKKSHDTKVAHTEKEHMPLAQKLEGFRNASLSKMRTLRMRRLIEHWSPTVILLFAVIKVLQIVKRCGITAKESGWRKATRTYLRTEHSKFSLAVFRLDYLSDVPSRVQSMDFCFAEEHLIKRLAAFLKTMPTSHWKIEWTRFWARRARKELLDIVHAEFHDDGRIRLLTPYFDDRGKPFVYLHQELQRVVLDMVIAVYNEVKDVADKRRPWLLRAKLVAMLMNMKQVTMRERMEALVFVDRALSGAFIHFETMMPRHASVKELQFRDPEFIKRKHPGFGLLNIVCRFNETLDEADLWFQFHHVPVDGVPMQSLLHALKNSWGVRGIVMYPAVTSRKRFIPRLCTTQTGSGGLYHCRSFFDFSHFLNCRHDLNQRYAHQVGGSITIVSMLVWGLSHHEVFQGKKFLFPVETFGAGSRKDASPSVVFIRPSQFIDDANRLLGFLAFQKEFNIRLHATRAQKSESHELLELYAVTSPFMYALLRRLMPKALGELVGTVGITMIKDSDLFMSPHTDLHTDGFLAFGNLMMPTEDGKTAGSVSIRGKKDVIVSQLEAVGDVVRDFERYL